MAIAPKNTTKITESQLRRIVRTEIANALPKRRSMREGPYDRSSVNPPTQGAMGNEGSEGSWTYDENGVGLDAIGEIADAWDQFTEACVTLSRFADMSFPEADPGDTGGPDSGDRRSGLRGEMVSVLEMAKHQIDVILDEQ